MPFFLPVATFLNRLESAKAAMNDLGYAPLLATKWPDRRAGLGTRCLGKIRYPDKPGLIYDVSAANAHFD
jgi:hypothetical protein